MRNKVYDMFYGAPPIIHQQAKKLRGRETKAEKVLWSALSNHQLDVKFRRQHPINQFIADFYCHELKLVVEVDGKIHDLQENVVYDEMRSKHLQNLGLHLIRFTNEQVLEKLEEVISIITRKVRLLQNPNQKK